MAGIISKCKHQKWKILGKTEIDGLEMGTRRKRELCPTSGGTETIEEIESTKKGLRGSSFFKEEPGFTKRKKKRLRGRICRGGKISLYPLRVSVWAPELN